MVVRKEYQNYYIISTIISGLILFLAVIAFKMSYDFRDSFDTQIISKSAQDEKIRTHQSRFLGSTLYLVLTLGSFLLNIFLSRKTTNVSNKLFAIQLVVLLLILFLPFLTFIL